MITCIISEGMYQPHKTGSILIRKRKLLGAHVEDIVHQPDNDYVSEQ